MLSWARPIYILVSFSDPMHLLISAYEEGGLVFKENFLGIIVDPYLMRMATVMLASFPVSLVESLAPADRGHAHFPMWLWVITCHIV